MTPAEARQLREAIQAALPRDPVQYDEPGKELVYVPRRHGDALDVNTMLVVGERGTGKSFWTKALANEGVRQLARENVGETRMPSNLFVRRGWDAGEAIADGQPTSRELDRLVEQGFQPRSIWAATYLVAAGNDELRQLATWELRVRLLEEDATAWGRLLRSTHQLFEQQKRYCLILFDELDRTSDDPRRRLELLRGLLQFLLDLRGTRFLRAKVFVRPDMLQASDVRSFPDASKIVGGSASLQWESTDLYALAWHRLANTVASGKVFQEFVRRVTGLSFEHKDGVFRMDERLRVDAGKQRLLFHALSGPAMGPNRKRGIPYVWLPGHLADARGIVTVRSFLIAVAQASQDEAHPTHEYPLHWDALKDGVREASTRRRQELEEDLPWANQAMTALLGLEIPCGFDSIRERWETEGTVAKVRESSRPPLIDPNDEPRSLLAALSAAGIFSTRPDGRLNVPDVYRVAYGLPLRGGVPTRPR